MPMTYGENAAYQRGYSRARRNSANPAIRRATSYQVLALLAADMDEVERRAAWTLVEYLREKELVETREPDENDSRHAY